MRKTIAAIGVAAALVGGTAALVSANAAVAQDDTTTTETEGVRPFDTVLSDLVAERVITQEQADAVSEALAESLPMRRGPGHHGGASLEVAAETIGIDVADLRTALAEGQTIADVAAAEGVNVADVIDALVAEANDRLDQAVADGRITAEDAEEHRADVTERVEALVNGERPADFDGFGRRGPGRHGFGFGSRGLDPAETDASV